MEDLLQPIQNKHVLQVAYQGGPQNLGELVAEESGKEERDLAFSIPREGILRVEAPHPIRVGPLVRLLEDG